jgi:hypothetical protein
MAQPKRYSNKYENMTHSLKHFLSICCLLFLTACGGNGAGGNGSATTPTNGMTVHIAFINSLPSDGYLVVQGNVYLFSNSDCPLFVSIFNSCFGTDPAAPYIIPQPPIEQSSPMSIPITRLN